MPPFEDKPGKETTFNSQRSFLSSMSREASELIVTSQGYLNQKSSIFSFDQATLVK